MDCATVDELAAAYALGALEADEERGVSEHLRTCRASHEEARALIGAGAAIPGSLPPAMPSAALRDRLMATIATTPQDHRPAPVRAITAQRPRPWWRLAPLPAGLAAVFLAAAVGLGAWNVSLVQQLADRDAALRAVASADAAHPVSGPAGSGWLLETDGRAIFMTDALADLPDDRIYELWLIGPDGQPVAVGTLDQTDGLAMVPLERELGSATVFAVTVEPHRVEAPTSEPVLVAELRG